MAQDPEREAAERSEEEAVARTFRLAAQYIALSFALQPGRDVYARSLKVVRPLLPGGHLRGGFLTAVHPDTDRTCAERCKMHFTWFHPASPGSLQLQDYAGMVLIIQQRELQ